MDYILVEKSQQKSAKYLNRKKGPVKMLMIPLDLVTSITAIALEQVRDTVVEPTDTGVNIINMLIFSNEKLYNIKEH